ncbi:MAG: hypothetical protein WCO63_07465 [Bacteroidota bacterium]
MTSMLILFQLSAQPSEGTISVGGSIGTHYNTNSSVKNFVLQLMPVGGYFLTNDLMAGMGLGYSVNTSKNKNPEFTTKGPLFHISPMVKYYWQPINRAGIFIQAYIDYATGNSKSKTSFGESTAKNTNFDFAFKSGLFLYVTPTIGVELSLSDFGIFTTKSTQNGSTTKTSTIGVISRPTNLTIFTFIK